MQRLPFQMIMMAKTHASDQRESEFLPHTLFLPMRRRRLRKRLIKVNSRCLKLYRAYVIRQMLANFFLELSSKGLYQSSGKEKEKCCLCSRPRQNVKFGTFTL